VPTESTSVVSFPVPLTLGNSNHPGVTACSSWIAAKRNVAQKFSSTLVVVIVFAIEPFKSRSRKSSR
jgi:hypothetical protein